MSRGFGFDYFRNVALGQMRASGSQQVPVVAFVSAKRRVARKTGLNLSRLQATAVLIADPSAVHAAVGRQSGSSRYVQRASHPSGRVRHARTRTGNSRRIRGTRSWD